MGRNLWFLSYGLLGLTQNGLLPVLMPLAAHGSAAGLTYAAFSLLGVCSPFLGHWADRTGRHRDLLCWGTSSAGLLLLAYDAAPAPLRILLAAGAGLGVIAATTAGNVLAIQGQPESQWNVRMVLLQRYISAGQVIGLGAAGLMASSHPRLGFAAAGTALLTAGILAFAWAPRGSTQGRRPGPTPQPMVGGDAGVSGTHHRGHHLAWPELGANIRAISLPLRQFLVVWLVAYAAMNGFATLFPVAVVREFGMAPIWPSCAYAAGVAASLPLYGPLGAATRRISGGRLLILGIGLRLVLLGTLVVASFGRLGLLAWIALIAFTLIQFVWPFLAVGANLLSVRLAPTMRGESIGLFNAATSLSSAIGSALAGVIFGAVGFVSLTATAVAVVGAAFALSMKWLNGWEASGTTASLASANPD